VELDITALTSATSQADMEALIRQLPVDCTRKLDEIENMNNINKAAKESLSKDIVHVAIGILLARFQQALVHTSNGGRFFPGKVDLPGNPGRRAFEGFIEIEDLSLAYEMLVVGKRRIPSTNPKWRVSKIKEELALKPYYYPHDIDETGGATGRATRDGEGLEVSEREGPREPDDDQTRPSTTSTPSQSVVSALLPESHVGSVEPDVPTSTRGVADQKHEEISSDGETDARLERTDGYLRKLESDRTQVEERKFETIQKQKDNERELSYAKQK
jgi:hypothetical protein